MATKVRIKADQDQDIPDIFSRPPSEVALEERAQIEAQIENVTPPWWVRYIPREFGNERPGELVKLFFFMFLAVLVHAIIWCGAFVLKSGAAHWISILVIGTYMLGVLMILIKDKKRGDSWVKIFGIYLLTQAPQLTYVGLLLLCLVEKYIEHRGWKNSYELGRLKDTLKRDPVDLARGRYNTELGKVRTTLLGPDSQMTTTQAGLHKQIGQVRVQLERVKKRLDEARTKNEAGRINMLEGLESKQRARLTALQAALEELEGRKVKAEAFFAECEALINELSGVAGDELLAREILASEGQDEALISAADDSGSQLMQKLGAAFQKLHVELAAQDLKRIATVASTGSVDELLGEDFDRRLEEAAAGRTGT